MLPGATNSEEVIQKVNIDCVTATGVQTLFTTRNVTGLRFIPTALIFELITVSVFTTVPTISFGQNGGSFNDIIAATPLTGVSSANNIIRLVIPNTVLSSIAANTAVGINVTVAAVSTTYAGNFYVKGFYR